MEKLATETERQRQERQPAGGPSESEQRRPRRENVPRRTRSTKRSNINTSKSTVRAADKESVLTLEKSRKTKQKSSPQRHLAGQKTSTKKPRAKEHTATAKPLSKFRIPKVKPTGKLQSECSESEVEHCYGDKRLRTKEKRKSDSDETILVEQERKSMHSTTTQSMETTRKRHIVGDYSYSKNIANKNLSEQKLKAVKCQIPKTSNSKKDSVGICSRESSPKVKKLRLTDIFPVVKDSKLTGRLPVPLDLEYKSKESNDREIANKMFAPVQLNVQRLSQVHDFIDDTMEMDWDNQVPEIRRLWNENSELSYTEGNEDDMEVDPTDILILVPDTNIWIGCVNLLKQLLNTDFPKVGFPTIVIPWMVLQELDVKSKSRDCKSARDSVKFIHSLLSSKHPRVKGQKASDAALSQLKFDDIVADDSILQCAFQLQRTDSTVVFLSNDRNLCNKGLVHGLITFGSEDVALKITKILTKDSSSLPVNLNYTMTTHDNGGMYNIGSCSKYNSTNLISQPNHSFSGHSLTFHQTQSTGAAPSNGSVGSNLTQRTLLTDSGQDIVMFKDVMDTLKSTIAYIIETKMKEDYGDTWNHTVKIQPPWSLLSGVKCMILHWIAVFSFVFGPKGMSSAEELYNFLKAYESSGRNHQMESDIIECAIGLFTMGKSSAIIQSPQVMNCRQMLMNFVASS